MPQPPRDGRPLILAVDDNPASLAAITEQLQSRYSAHYRVECFDSPGAALLEVERSSAARKPVALVMADYRMEGLTGVDLLIKVRELHRDTKRALLIDLNDQDTREPIMQAMALGRMDCYLIKPLVNPDEEFHRLVTDLLEEWSRTERSYPMLTIVGESWGRGSHQLRDILDRNNLTYSFVDMHSERGRQVLAETGLEEGPFPVVVLAQGGSFANPDLRELADRLTYRPRLDGGPQDVVIVGAGPAGLSAAVYAASEGLRVLVVEREAIGGQASTSSQIRNFLGFPRGISGSELASRAYQQAWMFGAQFTFLRTAVSLEVDGELRRVVLSDGTRVAARSVLLAMGVDYRRLNRPSLERFVGTGVLYGAGRSEAHFLGGAEVYVVGAGNSAGQAALHFSRTARRVTILVRGGSLAKSMSDYLVKEIEVTPNIRVLTRTEAVDGAGRGRLESLTLLNSETGREERVQAAALFVMIGAVPHTDWLEGVIARDRWGYILTGADVADSSLAPAPWPLARPPMRYETCVPGVFAVGDVRAESVKRVATAVGEGAMAVQLLHEYLAGLEQARASPQAAPTTTQAAPTTPQEAPAPEQATWQASVRGNR